MAKTIVAIHQPNFLPWLGFFNKMVFSDLFVFLDNVQLPLGSGSYVNRVMILINHQPHWITVPIDRTNNGPILIKDVKICNQTNWRKKMITAFQRSYGRHPYFPIIFPLIKEIFEFKTDSLSDFNIHAIEKTIQLLGIPHLTIIRASQLNVTGSKTDLLINITKAINGSSYLCGGGAWKYQEEEKFSNSQIDLINQNFIHPTYMQKGSEEFIPGLSILDALMNVNFRGVYDLLIQNK